MILRHAECSGDRFVLFANTGVFLRLERRRLAVPVRDGILQYRLFPRLSVRCDGLSIKHGRLAKGLVHQVSTDETDF